VLQIDRSASADVAASPARCLEMLAAVDEYPSWSSLIGEAAVLERGQAGSPRLVRLRATVFGLPVEMRCAMELGGEGAVLRRVPDSGDDPERYEATWRVTPAGDGASVELHVAAALDAPGPARLLGGRVGRVLVDELVADLARAVEAPPAA
jgi:hypothetical protein